MSEKDPFGGERLLLYSPTTGAKLLIRKRIGDTTYQYVMDENGKETYIVRRDVPATGIFARKIVTPWGEITVYGRGSMLRVEGKTERKENLSELEKLMEKIIGDLRKRNRVKG